MNALSHRSRTRTDSRATVTRKSVLFCPDCGRAASIGDWSVVAAAGADAVTCPDCDGTLTRRPSDRR